MNYQNVKGFAFNFLRNNMTVRDVTLYLRLKRVYYVMSGELLRTSSRVPWLSTAWSTMFCVWYNENARFY